MLFNLNGGRKLTSMGAAWFVSCLYCERIDPKHLNWQNTKTAQRRKSVFDRTRNLHDYWIGQIRNISDSHIMTNKIGLTAAEVKKMINKL
jgi:hypothetical protein